MVGSVGLDSSKVNAFLRDVLGIPVAAHQEPRALPCAGGFVDGEITLDHFLDGAVDQELVQVLQCYWDTDELIDIFADKFGACVLSPHHKAEMKANMSFTEMVQAVHSLRIALLNWTPNTFTFRMDGAPWRKRPLWGKGRLSLPPPSDSDDTIVDYSDAKCAFLIDVKRYFDDRGHNYDPDNVLAALASLSRSDLILDLDMYVPNVLEAWMVLEMSYVGHDKIHLLQYIIHARRLIARAGRGGKDDPGFAQVNTIARNSIFWGLIESHTELDRSHAKRSLPPNDASPKPTGKSRRLTLVLP